MYVLGIVEGILYRCRVVLCGGLLSVCTCTISAVRRDCGKHIVATYSRLLFHCLI